MASVRCSVTFPGARGNGRLITLSTLNAAAQLTLPRWFGARGLSVYLLVATGSQAIGAYVWGALATRARLDVALLGSAIALGVVVLSVAVLPLRPATGKIDVEVSNAWPTPMLMFEPCPRRMDRYWLPCGTEWRLRTAKNSSTRWAMSDDRGYGQAATVGGSITVSDNPTSSSERFTVASWSEFERQRTERWLDYDSNGVTTAIGYTVDNARRHEYYLALRVPR